MGEKLGCIGFIAGGLALLALSADMNGLAGVLGAAFLGFMALGTLLNAIGSWLGGSDPSPSSSAPAEYFVDGDGDVIESQRATTLRQVGERARLGTGTWIIESVARDDDGDYLYRVRPA